MSKLPIMIREHYDRNRFAKIKGDRVVVLTYILFDIFYFYSIQSFVSSDRHFKSSMWTKFYRWLKFLVIIDQIIIHIETIDFHATTDPLRIAENIVNLAKEIVDNSTAKVVISELVSSESESENCMESKQNRNVNRYCKQNGLRLIGHEHQRWSTRNGRSSPK